MVQRQGNMLVQPQNVNSARSSNAAEAGWEAELRARREQRTAKVAAGHQAAWAEIEEDEEVDNDHSAGIKPKTEYAIRALQVKFRSFVDEFKLAVDADAGPELQTLRQFTSYLHKNRHGYSSIGRVGMTHQFVKQAKYMLPKHIFPRVYPNWQGLSEAELETKCYPVMKAISDCREVGEAYWCRWS